jgi:hypothetical protein
VRYVCALMAVLILAYQVPSIIAVSQMPDWNGYGATDYEMYMAATREWLATGQFYLPHQLQGSYEVLTGVILYPPVALWLFVPFTVLPGFLWWVIPLAVTGWVIWRLRPGPLAWPLMALCLWGPVQIHIVSGNPGLYSMMFLALGLRYPWAAPFAFLKPTIGWVGLWGIRKRAWWVGLAVFCALSLPFLPMWFDWLTVIRNGDDSAGILYSWQVWPMMLLPILAWLARPGGRYDVERRAD